jgi:hypothetical protein
MPKDTAKWTNNIAWIKISRGDLVEHRREKNEIFPTDEHDFYIRPSSKPFIQIGCGSQSGESAASDYDCGLFHLLLNGCW